MLEFIENSNNDIELDGKVIVRGYSSSLDDFNRFAHELRNASQQHRVASIWMLDGYIMDIEDFIQQEQYAVKSTLNTNHLMREG